ncbi:hypothetical protein HZY97_20280 [Sphingomonas sp. R-74633]|uniref:hypothetical protein n=1 Tax=Sphingomonas sp. R-74633 TaxID=2751188 RepID=UPI0015D322AC|nr:hypothetical protein [Sphingomonas sp. R-74633]NYT43124.1 hypothetical protein [Sphingomonas sp. R-74633]
MPRAQPPPAKEVLTMAYHLQMPPTSGPLHLRKEARRELGEAIERMSRDTGYKFGPRGWAYYAEGLGLITKGEFDRFEKLLADMRKEGDLDPDVIEPDASRMATEVEDFDASPNTPEQMAQYAVNEISERLREWAGIFHTRGYWDDLEYYVEMIVEKKDLVQIFRSIADEYNIRITNGKGDTDIHTRLALLKRFRDRSEAGRRCILLAIGDHDPKGLHIVEGLHRTIMSCCNIKGLDWDYPDFEVVNIGLTETQIDDLGLMKIGNLETGGGRDLSDPRHPDHNKPYVQDYLAQFGVWKCEANALVGNPRGAKDLLESAINRFIPASHPGDVEQENEPGQEEVRQEIARLVQGWTFE